MGEQLTVEQATVLKQTFLSEGHTGGASTVS